MKQDIFSNLERYLSVKNASALLKVGEAEITRLVEQGQLKGAIMPGGSLGINEQSLQALLPREELPDYKAFAHLKGQEISISEAGRRYDLHTSTLTRWMQRGLVASLRKEGRLTLLDEADVAYCASIYHQNEGQGKWAFDKDGRPYRPGTEKG